MPTTITRRLAVMASIAALSASPAAPALAGKGGGGKPPRGGGSATISLVVLDATDGLAHWNHSVTFDVATTATTEPWVNLKCYQGGALVAEGWEGFFERALGDQVFRLASPKWTGGDADCTAFVTKPDKTVLGSTSFHVYP